MKNDLEAYAKSRSKRKRKDARIEFRIDPELFTWFKEYVEGLGLTITEALTFYIEQLRQSASDEPPVESEVQEVTVVDQKIGGVVPVGQAELSNEEEKVQKDLDRLAEWKIIKEYEIDERLYCPICGYWMTSNSFFYNHTKAKHESKLPEDIYQENLNKVIEGYNDAITQGFLILSKGRKRLISEKIIKELKRKQSKE